MHEMSLAEGIVQIIEDAAKQQGFSRVTTVFVELGELASVEPESLSFCFEAVTRNTVAAGAALVFVPIAGVGWCLSCSQSVALHQLHDPCPQCGSFQICPTAGTEMRVKELEVD
jgi:hydrogenase nickel incorporation protein HypA/HybF